MPYTHDIPIAEMHEIFHLMGETNRLQILFACLDTSVTVSDLANRFDLSMSLVSHHLRLLKAARLLRAERQGKHVFYRMDDDHIRCILKDMLTHLTEQSDTE